MLYFEIFSCCVNLFKSYDIRKFILYFKVQSIFEVFLWMLDRRHAIYTVAKY